MSAAQKGVINQIVFFFVTILVASGVIVGGSVYIKESNLLGSSNSVITKNSPVKTEIGEKNIITLQRSEQKNPLKKLQSHYTVYSYSYITGKNQVLTSFDSSAVDPSLKVSPDGTKIVFIGSGTGTSNEIKIRGIDNVAEKKFLLNKSNWSVETYYGGCHWSQDNLQLACLLIERESANGSGTGKFGISVLQLIDGNTKEVYERFLKGSPGGNVILLGWMGNKHALVLEKKQVPSEAYLTTFDFYSINIQTNEQQLLFSRKASFNSDPVSSANGQYIAWGEFDFNTKEHKIFYFDNNLKKIFSVDVTNNKGNFSPPSINVDNTNIFISIYKDKQRSFYEYNFASREIKGTNFPERAALVKAFLPDGKTFILNPNKLDDDDILFDSETKETIDLKGKFIGLGYF